MGAAGLDFAVAGGGTCTAGTYSAGNTCTVNVTFTPKFAGLRNGAVLLQDGSGNTIATGYVHGIGSGPQVSFLPGSQSTLGGGFSDPAGVAVDGSGNVFVADYTTYAVKEIPYGCLAASCIKTLVNRSSQSDFLPYDIAVDGSGNVFVTDAYYDVVKEIPYGCVAYSCVQTLGSGSGSYGTLQGIAVDGSGNVFFTDSGDSAVHEILAAGGYTTVKALGSGFYITEGIAVDGSGNVFVADTMNDDVKEILAAGGYTAIRALGSGLGQTHGLAVDGNGNVYVNDSGSDAVEEILAAGGYTTVKTLGGGFYAEGVAVDGIGNVYVADSGNHRVVKLDYADAPSLSFGSITVGANSAEQTVTLQNIGNATLTFPPLSTGSNPSISQYFTLDGSASTACPVITTSAAGSLTSGASCTLSISFDPTVSGSIGGSVLLTDNALNAASPNYATQTIALQGSGVQQSQTISFPSPGTQTYGTALTLAATASSGLPITYTVTSGLATVNGSTLTFITAGSVTIQANQPGNAAYLAAAPVSVTFSVNKATPAITWATPAAIRYDTALGSTQLNATSGGIAGSFAYTPAAGAVLNIGAQALSVTFTPTDTTDYTTATATVSLTVNRDATTTMVSVPSSVTLGSSVTLTATVSPSAATGTVTFKNGSTTLGTSTLSNGTATLNLVATTANGFAVGSDSIIGVYGSDSNDSGSTSSAVTLAVTAGTTNTTVTVSQSSSALGSSSATQSLTATVTTTSGTATGTVTFKVGSVTVGSVALSSGSATLSVAPTTANGFTVGSDTVTASYVPTTGTGFTASTGTQNLTVTAPAYTITPSATTVSLSKGGSQSVTATLASTTFADSTTWTATTSSPLIMVSPSSGTATLSANGSSTASLTITASGSAANHATRLPWTVGLIAFGAVLAGVPLARRRKRVLAVLLTSLGITTLGFLMSCGGGGGSTSTPPASPRSYTVSISGTGGVSSTIAVTVQ